MTPAYLIQQIAAGLGVRAVVCRTAEQLRDDREAAWYSEWLSDHQEPEDVGTAGALAYGDADLGTRCIISGGEVCEIDATREEDSDNLPF